MKQLFRSPGRGFVIEDVPVPVVQDGSVLVKTMYSAVSLGTELSTGKDDPSQSSRYGSLLRNATLYKKALNKLLAEGYQSTILAKANYNHTLLPKGYSLSGRVVEVGGELDGIRIGDMVACAGSGVASHAHYVSVPRNLICRIPAGVPAHLAAFTTIGAISMQAVRQSKTDLGETTVVLGLGLIGLLSVQLLKAKGCCVIAADLDPKKVELAKKVGADFGLVNQDSRAFIKECLSITDQFGADAVLVCASTPSSQPTNDAMAFLRKKGRLVIVGNVGLDLDRAPFYQNELDITISSSYGPGRYDPSYEFDGIDYPYGYVRWTLNRNMSSFLYALENHTINLDSLITHRIRFDQAPDFYNTAKTTGGGITGVLLEYDDQEADGEHTKPRVLRFKRNVATIDSEIRIGIIGAGGFAQRQHIPNLKKASIPNRIRAICTQKGENARKVAQIQNADYCTTDYREIIADEEIDAVVITTRHDSHAQIAIEALRAKKHVFIEKPMAIDESSFTNLRRELEKATTVVTVGFNRRYAPLSSKIAELLKNRTAPIQILYRVNPGIIKPTHWTQKRSVGGGRIIGEACHFIDLLKYFVSSEITSVSALGLNLSRNLNYPSDNFSANFSFEDGSIATLIYSSLANNLDGKEYIEVYNNGTTYELKDFKNFSVVTTSREETSLKAIDKGWAGEMEQFLKAVRGDNNSLMSIEDALDVTEKAFIIDKMVNTNA